MWFKTAEDLVADSFTHEAIVAYTSDFSFMGTAIRRHCINFDTENMQAARLDHSMWFHAEIKADQWLYYHTHSPRASNGRGLCRGSIYTQQGQLVVSVTEEGLMHLRSPQ